MTATSTPTYYDILGVPRNADPTMIRKSYLRESLRCHPDKNPGREDIAKAEFIRVGQAYAVLSDERKRLAYDRELDGIGYKRRTGDSRPTDWQHQQHAHPSQKQKQQYSGGNHTTNTKNTTTEQDEFDAFMRMFDETVSGMSEDELKLAIGAAAVVGSIVGSILGARAIKNPLLANAASMIGSAMASQAASKLVQTVHDDSQQRMIERRERDAAIDRGAAAPTTSSRESRERVFKDAGRAFQKVASAAVGGGGGQCSGNDTTSGNCARVEVERKGKFTWKQAADVVKVAMDICSDMQQNRGGGGTKSRPNQRL